MDSPSDGSGCRGRDWGVRPRALRRPGRHPRQRAAAPFLIRHLPQLTDRKLVDAVARHLRGTAEPRAAFPALREAFVGWAPIHPVAPGWTLGDLLAWAAQTKNADDLLELAQDTRYGMARQMIVDSLWRFKKHTQVEPVLIRLMSDPDVALHAMSALRRVVGNAAALPLIESVRDTAPDVDVRRIASEQARKALKGTG
jgi:hypothetical protein